MRWISAVFSEEVLSKQFEFTVKKKLLARANSFFVYDG